MGAEWWAEDNNPQEPLTLKTFKAKQNVPPNKKSAVYEWAIARFLSQRGCK